MTTLIRPMRRGGDYDKLTTKQKIFCDEILADPEFNGTRAARKAGYRTANVAANRCFHNPIISRIIGKHVHERLQATGLSADEVLLKLFTIITFDPVDCMEKRGNHWVVKDLSDIPPAIRQCITKIRTRTRILKDKTREVTIELEFMSKDQALTHAMKHFGLLGPDGNTTNINVGITFQDLLKRAEEARVHGKVIDAAFIAERVDET